MEIEIAIASDIPKKKLCFLYELSDAHSKDSVNDCKIGFCDDEKRCIFFESASKTLKIFALVSK